MLATRSALPYATANPPTVPWAPAAMDTPPPFSPPKRWQFSLKSLLIATMAVAILLGLGSTKFGFAIIVWSICTLLTKGVFIGLAIFAITSRDFTYRIVLGAAALGAWFPFAVEASNGAYNVPQLISMSWILFVLAFTQIFVCAALAFLVLKFARNRGWSRF
jgi:hypothetical protein